MADHAPIPASPEQVTAEWLSSVLSDAFPDVDLAGIDVLDQHAGTTGRMRIGLRHADGSDGPASVFVKLAPFDDQQRAMVAATDMGRREARFYAGPARELDLRVPTAFHAAFGDEPTEYIMVLEDLEAAGASFNTRTTQAADEHGRQICEYLATLHAHFWDDDRFDGELSWLDPAMRGEFGALLVQSAKDQFADRLPPVFSELCDLYVGNWEAVAEAWDDGVPTLIHGDTHAGNQFVEDGEVAYYDWAVISRSPGIRDLGIYLGNSCPTEIRRTNERDWIAAYRDRLVASGVDAPSFDELWLGYRRTVLYAWVAAATTASMGSKWQPIEIGMLGMQVATAACDDLDTLGAFREVV